MMTGGLNTQKDPGTPKTDTKSPREWWSGGGTGGGMAGQARVVEGGLETKEELGSDQGEASGTKDLQGR